MDVGKGPQDGTLRARRGFWRVTKEVQVYKITDIDVMYNVNGIIYIKNSPF